MTKIWAEYIWLGGVDPEKKVKTLRSKGRLLSLDKPFTEFRIEDIPAWGFDGSSTCQAEGRMSDVRLVPVRFVRDPIRTICGDQDILVLCETRNVDGTPHETNTRHRLVEAAQRHNAHEAIFGIEQEYTLYDRDGVRPFRWPDGSGYPAPQGRYYCGVGCDEVYGEEVMEAHTRACLKAGLMLAGVNAEVMPAQWEFQIGTLSAPEAADELWLARWLLYKVAAKFGISVKLDPKPMKGDWNGTGCHTNFSTRAMRDEGGLDVIIRACEKLGRFHKEHIAVYGPFNSDRLTGKHETCNIDQFRYGPYDRGASIRIPIATMDKGKGYLEDRRPAANADPYEVCLALLETICGNGFRPSRRPDVELQEVHVLPSGLSVKGN
jgi:glutamine synthetase